MNDLVHALMEARQHNPRARRSIYATPNFATPLQGGAGRFQQFQELTQGGLESPLDPWGTSPEDLSDGARDPARESGQSIFENQQTDNVPPSGGLSEDQRRKLEDYESRLDTRKESARRLQTETIEGIVRDMEENNDPLASKARACQSRSPDNGAQFLECLLGLEGTRA